MFIETRKYSFAKSISWRILATLMTIIISFCLTNNINIATSIGILEFFVKIILYYLHERFWFFLKHSKRKNLNS